MMPPPTSSSQIEWHNAEDVTLITETVYPVYVYAERQLSPLVNVANVTQPVKQ